MRRPGLLRWISVIVILVVVERKVYRRVQLHGALEAVRLDGTLTCGSVLRQEAAVQLPVNLDLNPRVSFDLNLNPQRLDQPNDLPQLEELLRPEPPVLRHLPDRERLLHLAVALVPHVAVPAQAFC